MAKPSAGRRKAAAGATRPVPAPAARTTPVFRRERVVPDQPAPATLGGRLTVCREAKQLSQADCARAVKITPQSWGQLESGQSKQPAADTLLDMRDKLGFDPDYIVRGRGMPLLPNFEDLAREQALLSIFRELKPENKRTALNLVQGIRRAQGGGPSASDPFEIDPPDPTTN